MEATLEAIKILEAKKLELVKAKEDITVIYGILYRASKRLQNEVNEYLTGKKN